MPAADRPRNQTDPASMEFISEARRPIIVRRHLDLIREMEAGLSNRILAPKASNPRLRAVVEEVEGPDMRQRIAMVLDSLAGDRHYRGRTFREAVVEELCLWRDRSGAQVAELQEIALGCYRLAGQILARRQGGPAPALDELRDLPADRLGQLLAPVQPSFGRPAADQLRTAEHVRRSLDALKALVRRPDADPDWADADGGPALGPTEQASLERLPSTARIAARAQMTRERIRSRFYRQVFTQYLGSDELDPKEAAAHPTVLAWMQAIDETPHLYPFLQGQSPGQKSFRIARLAEKLVQIHEIYARLERARADQALAPALAGKGVRECLGELNRRHVPPLPAGPGLTLAALLSPFPDFAAWVQRLVATGDFVVPPDARH